MSTKLLVLGIDAFDPDFFYAHRDVLPHLDSIASGGRWGRLRSTIPPVTGPAWTTAFSGMNPGRTGITSFTSSDIDIDHSVLDSRDVKVPRVWNVLSAQDLRCAVIGVPLAYPVEEINGLMVGGFMTPSMDVPFTYPPSLQRDLVASGYEPSIGLSHDPGAEGELLDRIHRTARVKYEWTHEWLAQDDWDCFLVVYSEPDWVQHLLVRPEDHPDHRVNNERLLAFFIELDAHVGRLLRAAGPDATTLVCSDHGFGHFVRRYVHVNRFLANEGYVVMKGGVRRSLRRTVGRHLRGLTRLPGWRQLRQRLSVEVVRAGLEIANGSEDDFDLAQSSAIFHHQFWFMGYVDLNEDLFEDREQFDVARDRIINLLRELVDPRTNLPVFGGVYARDEVFHGPFADREPDIVCLFAQGYGGSDLASPRLVSELPVQSVPGAMHRRDGIWMLGGPTVATDSDVITLDLQDIAPLIFHILGASPPRALDGRVPYQLFETQSDLAVSRRAPIDFDTVERRFVLPTPDQEEDADAVIAERLRALGYVE